MLNELLESSDRLKNQCLKHNIFWDVVLMTEILNLSGTSFDNY